MILIILKLAEILKIVSYISFGITAVLWLMYITKSSKHNNTSNVSLLDRERTEEEQNILVSKFKFEIGFFVSSVIYFIRKFMNQIINGIHIPDIAIIPGWVVCIIAAALVLFAVKNFNKGKLIKASSILLVPSIMITVYYQFIIMHLY